MILFALLGSVLAVFFVIGLRRHGLVTLALRPGAASMVMVAACAIAGLPVHFLDLIALPITIGIGIEYAVNLAARERAGRRPRSGHLLATTVAPSSCARTRPGGLRHAAAVGQRRNPRVWLRRPAGRDCLYGGRPDRRTGVARSAAESPPKAVNVRRIPLESRVARMHTALQLIPDHATADPILFTPGPVRTPPLVAESLSRPPCNYHRQDAFAGCSSRPSAISKR